MDSSQIAGAPAPTPEAVAQAMPMTPPGAQPTMVLPTPPTNGAGPDAAVASIMSTVKNLL